MRTCWLASATALLIVVGATDQVLAQGTARWTVNPYVGVFIPDDGGLSEAAEAEDFNVSVDPALLLGGRIGYRSASSWGFEAGYGYSPVTINLEDQGGTFDLDATAHLYYGALSYFFPSSGAASFFVSVGAGGILVKADDASLFEGAEDSSNDLLVNAGAGLIWSVNDRLSIRGDVKDHIDFCKAADDLDDFTACPFDDKALNHIEVSGGISFLLGGGM